MNKNKSQTDRLADKLAWRLYDTQTAPEFAVNWTKTTSCRWSQCGCFGPHPNTPRSLSSFLSNKASVKSLINISWGSDFRDQWGIASRKRTMSVNICQSKAPDPGCTEIRLMIIANEIGGATLAKSDSQLQTGLVCTKNLDPALTLVI